MSPIPEIVLKRTLHPVGQGGFYTEQIVVADPQFKDSKLYTIVYDCGSQAKRKINSEIQRTFPKDTLIDALFISHFDNDHINGLSVLRNKGVKVRYLILPLLTNTQKTLAFLSIGLMSFDVNSIKTHLGIDAETVIFVATPSALSNGNLNISPNPNQPPNTKPQKPNINIGESQKGVTEIIVESGTALSINTSIKWIYKPFNLCDDSLYEKLLEKLDSDKQLKEKLTQIAEDSMVIKNIKDKFEIQDQNKLRDIYNEITGGHKNKSSMVVYSGPEEIQKRNFSRFIPIIKKGWFHSFLFSSYKNQLRKAVGVIYTGDLDLNAIISLGPDKPNIAVCDYLSQKLQDYSEIIGTIQVPHHGSRHNFNPSIIQNFPNAYIYFCSYGINNTYHHPYAGIRITLMAKMRILLEITEEKDSEFIQLIEIK